MRKSKLAYLTERNIQLSNDLAAAKTRENLLLETCDNLRCSNDSNAIALTAALHERDDWRDAFKLIMKLVK